MNAPKVERNAEIVRLHVLEGLPFSEIGEIHNITRERVRQIVRSAGISPAQSREFTSLALYGSSSGDDDADIME